MLTPVVPQKRPSEHVAGAAEPATQNVPGWQACCVAADEPDGQK